MFSRMTVKEAEIRRRVVGDFLSQQRRKVGLTQKDVSLKLNYTSPQFVSNWERGLSLPPMEVLPLISRIYDLNASDIIDVLATYQERLASLQRETLEEVFKKSSDAS